MMRMNIWKLVLLCFGGLLSVNAARRSPIPGFGHCNVCGTDNNIRVTLPDTIINIPDDGPVSCGEFERAGDADQLALSFCSTAQELTGPCGCRPMMRLPNDDMASAPFPPSPGFAPCSVCGTFEQQVTLPDVMLNILDLEPVSCDFFQRAGLEGHIDPLFCEFLTAFAEPCGCQATSAPVSPPITFPPSPNFEPCNLCADGGRVANVNEPLDDEVERSFLSFLPMTQLSTCGDLQQAADLGFLNPDQCQELTNNEAVASMVMRTCGCPTRSPTRAPVTEEPSPIPTAIVTDAPTRTGGGNPVCNICGSLNVTQPNGLLIVRLGDEPRTCLDVERSGQTGFIQEVFCPFVQDLAVGACGCGRVPATMAPVASAATMLPTEMPAVVFKSPPRAPSVPTYMPSRAPVVVKATATPTVYVTPTRAPTPTGGGTPTKGSKKPRKGKDKSMHLKEKKEKKDKEDEMAKGKKGNKRIRRAAV